MIGGRWLSQIATSVDFPLASRPIANAKERRELVPCRHKNSCFALKGLLGLRMYSVGWQKQRFATTWRHGIPPSAGKPTHSSCIWSAAATSGAHISSRKRLLIFSTYFWWFLASVSNWRHCAIGHWWQGEFKSPVGLPGGWAKTKRRKATDGGVISDFQLDNGVVVPVLENVAGLLPRWSSQGSWWVVKGGRNEET